MKSSYKPQDFEAKIQKKWESEGTYVVKNPTQGSKKSYTLAMFPYPSGAGLHVGHVRIYTGTDVLARFMRMQGYSVLNPMGWDAFGLPAENAAIKAKGNPMDMVPHNIDNFRKQMKSLGFSFDFSREFATTDPAYYKWTQWIFLQLYSIKNDQGQRLIYRKEAPIQWCPSCKTGLANEEVLPDGTHERCGNTTEERLLPQWMMRITDYADALLKGLDEVEWTDSEGKKSQGLDWPKGILEMQRNWIGKKEGMIVHHAIDGLEGVTLDTFSAYPEWSYADTFIAVAPEHPIIKALHKATKDGEGKQRFTQVEEYLAEVKKETRDSRTDDEKEKTGVFTGYYAKDPFRKGQLMPIWIANFALMDFGTGAIRCSAHDPRDVKFATKYDIPLRSVLDDAQGKPANAHIGTGVLADSGPFTGRKVEDVRGEFITHVESQGWGKRHVTYHLRDWIFSRQRYWGEPFPLVYCAACGDENGVVTLPETDLPVELPYLKSYEPTDTGESPLSEAEAWVYTKCPKCGGQARRETDTMPNWAGSCWYFIAFACGSGPVSLFPQSSLDAPVGGPPSSTPDTKTPSREIWSAAQKAGSTWLPVDWYLGGAEHAVLHLLYARFWVKALHDLGLVDMTEPFLRLRNVGMVLAEDGRKMSKSLGNVVNPDDVVEEYGADVLRIYEMFLAPFAHEVTWSARSLKGGERFLTRIWQIYDASAYVTDDVNEEDKGLAAELQRVITKVTSDLTNVKFNTPIAAMMEFINRWEAPATGPVSSFPQASLNAPVGGPPDSTPVARKLHKENAKRFLQLLAPFAPHITEEIWVRGFGESRSIHLSQWPVAEKHNKSTGPIKIPVQVNGKVRDILTIESNEVDEHQVERKALKSQKVMKWITGREYGLIYVKSKILSLTTDDKS